MKAIIAGSRDINNIEDVYIAVEEAEYAITEIVSGGARGVDKLGEEYARKQNIKTKIFKADWSKFGKSAGYKRNTQMAEYADALIAIWDGESHGTKHMIDEMRKKRKPVYVYIVH